MDQLANTSGPNLRLEYGGGSAITVCIRRAAMHQATDPSDTPLPHHLESPQSVAIGELRPLLATCRALLGVAAKEPPFLSRHRVLLSTWGPVLGSLDNLVTRVAALESLLEGDCV